MARYVVDRQKIEAEVARRRAIQEKGWFAWFTRVLFVNLLVLYAVVFVASPQNRAFDGMPTWRLFLVIGLPFVAAAIASAISTRAVFRAEAVDPERLADRVAREVQSLAGPGWALRSLRAGLLLGVAVGVAAGLLVILVVPAARLPGTNRWLGLLLLVALTQLWAIPMAFLLRWWSLITYRRLLTKVD